jgi:hypothetical protein
MKNFKFLILGLLVSAFFIFGCKKSSSVTPTGKSQWSYKGKTYTADTTYIDTTIHFIYAQDTAGNYVFLDFNKLPPPSGSYTVINIQSITYSDELTSTQCVLEVGVGQDITTAYGSSGSSGTATVTNSGGKLHVSFSNVSATSIAYGDSTNIAGQLVLP